MNKHEELAELKKEMLADDSLPLKKGATNLVFGSGSPDTKVMFIGEGPGYWEDQKGIPFVGNAGALLNQLIELAGLKRDEVFITNVVHYRPPENRDPEEDELMAFRPYLDKMIEIIDPEVIVTLGRFSMGKFLPGVMISKVHGKKHSLMWKTKQIAVFPMYHPAAGLRNGSIKQSLYEDFKNLKKVLESSDDQKETTQATKIEQMNLI
ncbi:uracil-DNA glycosylase [Candidatus Woesebacteria bacterium]|nr:MAG: uracil-DNA glycosylase [Candidatus Woesebacteria bacterium]